MNTQGQLILASFALTALLGACVSEPDHFYTLTSLPIGERTAQQPTPTTHVLLDVTVPSIVDRSEMVITTSANRILILDHQRWAAPLADQVSQTLARDIELQKSTVLVADRRFDQGAIKPIVIKVEIVQLSAQKPGVATLEAHWRIIDEAKNLDQVGGNAFSASVAGNDYQAVARAYSDVLGALARQLTSSLE